MACGYLSDGPFGVFGDEWVVVLSDGVLKGGDVVGCADVAEGDADVAQETRVFGAFDGGFRKDGAELVDAER